MNTEDEKEQKYCSKRINVGELDSSYVVINGQKFTLMDFVNVALTKITKNEDEWYGRQNFMTACCVLDVCEEIIKEQKKEKNEN